MVERVTAKKCRIIDLVNGRYILKDGTQPSYVETPYGEINKVNLIAAIVAKPGKKSIIVDDGSSQVEARSFDDETLFERVAVGDVVLLIGRPRRFQEQTYVVAEICKQLSSLKWLELRHAELVRNDDEKFLVTHQIAETTKKKDSNPNNTPSSQQRVEENSYLTNPLLKEKKRIISKKVNDKQEDGGTLVTTTDNILTIIRELDTGQGAPVEKVIAKTGRPDAETILTNLLAEGEIFEIRPGRVKVLE